MHSPRLFRGICVIGVLLGSASCNLDQEKQRKAEAIAVAEEAQKVAEEKRKAEAEAKEQQLKIDSLLTQLANAKDEATREALQKQLEAVKAKEKGKASGERNTAPTRATAKPCNCEPSDPLCSCL